MDNGTYTWEKFLSQQEAGIKNAISVRLAELKIGLDKPIELSIAKNVWQKLASHPHAGGGPMIPQPPDPAGERLGYVPKPGMYPVNKAEEVMRALVRRLQGFRD